MISVSFIIVRLTGDAGDNKVEEAVEDASPAQILSIAVAEDAGATQPACANLTVGIALKQAVLPVGHLCLSWSCDLRVYSLYCTREEQS